MYSSSQQPRTTLCRVGRANAEALAGFRAEVGSWLDGPLMIAAERRADIVLAVDEALSNCAQHVYGSASAGTMTLELSHHDGSARVSISDRGAWTEPTPKGVHSAHGRGLELMRRLADELSIDGRPGGTTVRLRFEDRALR